MALVRATLQTALPTVRALIGDLKKLARETGSSPAIDTLAQNLDALAQGLGAAPCLGLVRRLPDPTPEAIHPYLNVPALHAIFEAIKTEKRDTA